MRAITAVGIAFLLLAGCGGGDEESQAVESPDLASPRAERIRACLTDAGMDVLGGRSSPSDRDAPDVELITSIGGSQLFIAIYRTSAEAAKREVEIQTNSDRFGGQVDREGSVTVVWASPPAAGSGETIEQCAFA